MFGIGMQELVIILILALIIFGPGKLPEVGKAIGKSIREFKQASRDITESVSGDDDEVKKDDEKKA
ncbi:MAG: twin-arginine translocase TatA/TatE family subunit [Firmicutes bacterium]|nr:twin-arginine translocase TatA/TatE family subunit [Bacillota bacterium]